VTVAGTAIQGQTLTAANTLADVDGIPTTGASAIAYQWRADGTPISGATGSTLALTQALVGKAITVTAAYTDNFGQAESVTSSATTAVANVNDPPTGAVTITGTAIQGQTLTAANTLADVDGIPTTGAGAIAYQWRADGTPISGATGSTLALTQALVGKAITVTAAYTDNFGQAESVTSSATMAVQLQLPPPEVEAQVPGLGTGSGQGVVGDGNGDGVADSLQPDVVSTALVLVAGSPGASPYVTFVADSAAGKSNVGAAAPTRITEFAQVVVPAAAPKALELPLALTAFKAEAPVVGQTVKFSLYVDSSLGVNGYWKQSASGVWVNLASQAYGGAVILEGNKTRLDFSIVDGGPFDEDGKADGVVTDPGGAGAMRLTIVGNTPDNNDSGFWF
jgi:putative intracellular protease/amidase